MGRVLFGQRHVSKKGAGAGGRLFESRGCSGVIAGSQCEARFDRFEDPSAVRTRPVLVVQGPLVCQEQGSLAVVTATGQNPYARISQLLDVVEAAAVGVDADGLHGGTDGADRTFRVCVGGPLQSV
jgi:hypothetical protein